MTEKISNKQKRVPKAEVKSNIQFSQEQKEAKELIRASKVTILHGKAGTSKTTCAVLSAVDMYFKREIDKIYICRPVIPIEDLGYLKGSAGDKTEPYIIPYYQNLYKAYTKPKIDKMIADGDIEIVTLAFIQGWTIDGCLLVDEAQNLSEDITRIILTRLGKGSKLIFTGDTDQVMLKDKKKSGFKKLLELEGQIEGLAVKEMLINYRDEFVQKVIELY